ncbi:MAG: recombinase RecF [Acidobacteria bacterium]|nr:MAG: recombinase RecF [Acidobacteriota bacterium]
MANQVAVHARPQQRLRTVKLERFKAAFKPEEIPLRPFTVVIGRNGSGKSTLLEALQWLDTTVRRDAREACDRYFGVQDLVNLRSQTEILYFRLTLEWQRGGSPPLRYRIRVEERDGAPVISEEILESLREPSRRRDRQYVSTESGYRRIHTPNGAALKIGESDRLAISFAGVSDEDGVMAGLADFWARAVFLRLSPNRLANGSLATRKSFEPLLDEEGQTLPALLNELTGDQRADLVQTIREILPGIRGVEVSKAELGRDTRVNYSLLERMPYRGRRGRSQFPIPAWMLSEGTRRITALLALLCRDPPPSLLCIEEIENGLDPWTVREILRHLQSAAERGTQIIVTTHSPWVLDDVPMESILLVRRSEGDTQYQHFASMEEVQDFDPSIPAGTRYVNLTEAPSG